MKILWLVVARSGSKSVPNKNINLLGNKPLLQYRIERAKETKISSEIWLSTDSEKYAEIGKYAGAKIPFIRPQALAQDTSSSIDVVLHAMNFAINNKMQFDYIGLLEPTSPFISSESLNNAINILQNDKDADAIVAVKESRPNTFFIQEESKYLEILNERFGENKNLNRQNFAKQITPSGGFYIAKWDNFLLHKTFYTAKTISYLVSDEEAIEIDEAIDWEFAEFLINKKNKNEL